MEVCSLPCVVYVCDLCVGLRRGVLALWKRVASCLGESDRPYTRYIHQECIGVAVICWGVCLVPFVTLLILRDEWTRHIHVGSEFVPTSFVPLSSSFRQASAAFFFIFFTLRCRVCRTASGRLFKSERDQLCSFCRASSSFSRR